MIESASQTTVDNIPTQWVTECPDIDASPFLKLALLLIAVFCVANRLLGGQTFNGFAVAGLGLLYAIGVVALTMRTYRQS